MMRPFLISLLCLLSFSSFGQHSNLRITPTPKERFAIKANPLSIFLGTGTIFFEGRLSPATSAQLGVSYFNWTIDGDGVNGITFTPEFRFFFREDALDGPYLAPFLRLRRWEVTDNGKAITSYNTLGAGFVFGRQWITDSGFDIDIFFGFQMTQSRLIVEGDPNYDEPSSTIFMDGFWPRVGMGLGYSF